MHRLNLASEHAPELDLSRNMGIPPVRVRRFRTAHRSLATLHETLSVRYLYYGYERVARRLVDGIRGLDADTLALGPDGWPIWAIAAHVAGTRIY